MEEDLQDAEIGITQTGLAQFFARVSLDGLEPCSSQAKREPRLMAVPS
jgi:hypothetical protein